MCSDAVEVMQKVGILPLDTPENRIKFGNAVMSHTGFNKRYPDNWQVTAKMLSLDKFYVTQSVQALFTAMVRRKPSVIGREGHSVLYCRPSFRMVRGKRQRGIIYPNSWGEWGFAAGNFDYGFGWDSESQVAKSARYALILQSLTVAKFRRNRKGAV